MVDRLARLLDRARPALRGEQLALHLLALGVGVAAAAGAVVFREAIDLFQLFFLGFRHENVGSGAVELPAWRLLLAPTAGGLLIGYLSYRFVPGGRPQGVAHVIEANARLAGRMSLRQGISTALINAASIGSGASTGREGPAVHFGAAIASWLGRPFRLTRSQSRTLLGCGVAAAVAASFNAPIAGVFFALEVVIGHYALQAFSPIVVASVAGTLVSRMYFGDYPAFILPEGDIRSFWEFPAFALLGVASAAVAIAFMRLAGAIELGVGRLVKRGPLPPWLFPAFAGFLVGVMALRYPELLGVGYEATDNALRANYELSMLVTLLALKIVATAACVGCGFGGGVFSPALFLGAMLGGAFGQIAAIPFPDLHSGAATYSLIGMGAVAGAVLGAPISTILMVFELTGDYRTTLGVMVAVSIASIITKSFHSPSFFADQLARRGVPLSGGHDSAILSGVTVDFWRPPPAEVNSAAPLTAVRAALRDAAPGPVMVVDDARALVGTIELGDLPADNVTAAPTAGEMARPCPEVLLADADLAAVVAQFERGDVAFLPVVEDAAGRVLRGLVTERDALRAYNRRLLRQRAEEHGE